MSRLVPDNPKPSTDEVKPRGGKRQKVKADKGDAGVAVVDPAAAGASAGAGAGDATVAAVDTSTPVVKPTRQTLDEAVSAARHILVEMPEVLCFAVVACIACSGYRPFNGPSMMAFSG